jgi:hypothetical protein
MKERPILFSGPMVRALLDGGKTQTRRVVKTRPIYDGRFAGNWKIVGKNGHEAAIFGPLVGELCPYGKQDDRLWVRETWMPDAPHDGTWASTQFYGCETSPLSDIPERFRKAKHCIHRASWDGPSMGSWTASIHMPRWASRITLEITGVRVERLQDISEADALAEGIVRLKEGFGLPDGSHFHAVDPRQSYFSLWEAINGPGSVQDNPWLWVIEFSRMEGRGGA